MGRVSGKNGIRDIDRFAKGTARLNHQSLWAVYDRIMELLREYFEAPAGCMTKYEFRKKLMADLGTSAKGKRDRHGEF